MERATRNQGGILGNPHGHVGTVDMAKRALLLTGETTYLKEGIEYVCVCVLLCFVVVVVGGGGGGGGGVLNLSFCWKNVQTQTNKRRLSRRETTKTKENNKDQDY